jgi:ubiquinone/menaquinone biosynthesis C-methylase UbiE
MNNKNAADTATIESVTTFWDDQPCNIKHSSKQIGSIEYFNEVENKRYFVEPHILHFANFPFWREKKVLEIGMGIGTDAINFARSGAIFTGVELSQETLKIAKTRFQVFKEKGNLLQGNAEQLESLLGPQTFDLIYSFGVLHHTPNIEAALKQIRTICHSQTRIKIMVYAKNSWKQKMIDNGLDQYEAQSGCPIANSYEEADILKLFNSANLDVISISQDHIFPYQINPYKDGKFIKEIYFDAMPTSIFDILKANFGWHLLIDAKPNFL